MLGRSSRASSRGPAGGTGNKALPLCLLALQLTPPPRRIRGFADTPFRRLLVVPSSPQFAEQALALHLFLKRAEGLVDIVVTNVHGDDGVLPLQVWHRLLSVKEPEPSGPFPCRLRLA